MGKFKNFDYSEDADKNKGIEKIKTTSIDSQANANFCWVSVYHMTDM